MFTNYFSLGTFLGYFPVFASCLIGASIIFFILKTKNWKDETLCHPFSLFHLLPAQGSGAISPLPGSQKSEHRNRQRGPVHRCHWAYLIMYRLLYESSKRFYFVTISE